MGDYVRQMPHQGSADLARPPSTASRLHIDIPLLLLLMALTTYGLFVLYSASGQNMGAVVRQGRYFAVGYVILILGAQVSLQRYTRWAPWLYLAGVATLVAVMFFGVGAKGAQRWLQIGGFRFQPSEIMKLVVPIAVAWYLSDRILPPRFKYVLVSLALVVVPAGLILQQPDLGTSLLIAASGLFVLFMAGIGWRYIFGAVLLAVASAWPAWMFVLKDYQKQRILTMLNPESDKLGAGWNIIQSKTAIGSGGLEGKGYMLGTQAQLDFLPESHTDFIVAVLAEEMGYIGVVVLIVLYLAITGRGLIIAARARESFGRLLAGSLILTFFIYVFVNIGMVSGILPVVGVPLPLVSYGGTSAITLMAGFGIIMSMRSHKAW